MDAPPRMAFWLHQAMEYLLGLFLLLTALRLLGPPALHAIGGGLVLIALAASTRGPLGAFRFIGRATHRVLDIVVAMMLAASPLLLRFDNVGMVILAEALALAMATLVRRTAYADPVRPPRRDPAASPIIDTVTRLAGDGARAAGNLVGKAGKDAPRRLGRFVGKRKRS